MPEDSTPQPRMFVRGNDHLDRLLSDPQTAAEAVPDDLSLRDHALGLRMLAIDVNLREYPCVVAEETRIYRFIGPSEVLAAVRSKAPDTRCWHGTTSPTRMSRSRSSST